MLEFKNIQIEDKSLVEGFLKKSPRPSLEYNFTTMFIWQGIYNTKFAICDGFLFVSSGKKTPSFLFPIGEGDKKEALNILEDYCKENNFKMNFYALTKEDRDFLTKEYPERYSFSEERNLADYVYSADSLRFLQGKKLSSKRNHINYFIKENPDFKYEPLNEENIEEAYNMHNLWCDGVECEKEQSLKEETCAVRRAFKYFKPLELSGGLLRVGGRVVAFSMGDELNEKTFLVHIEKAYSEIRGAYPMINQQFVKNECEGYEFINREDDTGDEGLRKAKLSYRPIELVEKYKGEER